MNADTSALFNPAFPLVPHAYVYGNFTANIPQVLGGSFSLFELSGVQTGRQLIQLLGPGGTDVPAKLRVAIVRTN